MDDTTQILNPNQPQQVQTQGGNAGLTQAQRAALMSAMMSQNGNGASSTGGAVGNALASGIQGYLTGLQLQKLGGQGNSGAGMGYGGGQMAGASLDNIGNAGMENYM